MKSDNLLVIAVPFKFNSHDFNRFEVEFFEKYIDVHILDVGYLIFPELYKNTKIEDGKRQNVNSIKSFKELFYYFNDLRGLRDLKKRYSKIYFMNYVEVTNVKSLMFNYLLKYFDLPFISCINPGIPIIKTSTGSNFLAKVYFSLVQKGFKFVLIQIYFYLAALLSRFFKIHPKYVLIAGGKYYQKYKNSTHGSADIIKGHSWDCSMYYAEKRRNYKKDKGKIIVLLEGVTPILEGDSLVLKNKKSFTAENWFPSICKFLDKVEGYSDLKTKVAAHPKSTHVNNPAYLGYRSVIFNDTFDLIKKSSFVITRNSAAISIAVLFDKPVVFIYNDELRRNDSDMSYINTMAQSLGTKSINIDKNHSKDDILNLLKVNKKSYQRYVKNYLTSRKDEIPNYKVILSNVFNVYEK